MIGKAVTELDPIPTAIDTVAPAAVDNQPDNDAEDLIGEAVAILLADGGKLLTG